jgi:hypothetical protein
VFLPQIDRFIDNHFRLFTLVVTGIDFDYFYDIIRVIFELIARVRANDYEKEDQDSVLAS